jgi:hypothetical protein
MFTMLKNPTNKNSILNTIYKNITLFLFFILPSKISNIFVNLSIIALIYDLRNVTLCKSNINTDKIHSLLQISVSEEILLLPNYTINWFWDDAFLNSTIVIRDQEYLLKDAIKDSELFFGNLRLVLDKFLDHLPNTLKIKLGMNNVRNRIEVKHGLMNILIYS